MGNTSAVFVATHFDSSHAGRKKSQMQQLAGQLALAHNVSASACCSHSHCLTELFENLRGKHFANCTKICVCGDFNLCPQTKSQGGYDADNANNISEAFQELQGV